MILPRTYLNFDLLKEIPLTLRRDTNDKSNQQAHLQQLDNLVLLLVL